MISVGRIQDGANTEKLEHTIHEDRLGDVVGVVAGHDVVHVEDVGASVDRLSSEHATIGA